MLNDSAALVVVRVLSVCSAISILVYAANTKICFVLVV